MTTPTQSSESRGDLRKANIAIVGCGWWTQGWHCPVLHNNPNANLVALVDTSPHPKSNLEPNLISLEDLGDKYGCKIFSSVDDLLASDVASALDGVIVATPHATHYDVGNQLMERGGLHIMMEKPMSTLLPHAIKMKEMVDANSTADSKFLVNHSANYRTQAKLARDAIADGKIGRVRHIKAMFASPLKSIFEDPANKGWNEPSEGMDGNGFGWGQSSHLFAFLFHICPDLVPQRVYCDMVHSDVTGADVSFSATITCHDGVDDKPIIIGASGTTLLNGDAHSDPPVGKKVSVEIYGSTGTLMYSGVDRDPKSGKLELYDEHGNLNVLHDEFHFENLDHEGLGPESIRDFVNLCRGSKNVYEGATVSVGLRSVQTIDAMYRSNKSSQVEQVHQN